MILNDFCSTHPHLAQRRQRPTASSQLATRFDLRRDAGDIVRLDCGITRDLAPQVIHAFKDGRPAVLLDAPPHWWHTRVSRAGRAPIAHLTQLPCHGERERLPAQGPIKPSALRRRARASVPELREFLHAALLLNLVAWQDR